ncbi:uncharacterized protein LOC112087544 [Eutrema salsugineum]|uniref:uncharacterized protein LOC112087544 n=1 Tax=Eutrema salsugineum TaxID=72664 RepID=UPI000CED00B7|nr:uncharacterized protein LOC112087544 [Eutrema salsugineum]
MTLIRRRSAAIVPFVKLDQSSKIQKVRATIFSLWKVKNRESGFVIEMVLIDEEGTRIHATVDEELIAKHKGILIEGKSLSINCFIIKEYYGDFRTTPLPYKIALCRTTRAKEITDFPLDLPEKYLSDFKSIKEDKLYRNILIDVIGEIVTVESMEVIKTKGKSGISEKLMITLRDTNICDILISNAFNSTKILFDPSVKIVKDFREKYVAKKQSNDVHAEQSYSISWGGAIDYREEFLGMKNRRRTIAEIRDTKVPGKIVTCVTVKDVDTSKLGIIRHANLATSKF